MYDLKTILVFMKATSGEIDKNQHYKNSKKSPAALNKRNFENNSAGDAENSVFYLKCQFFVEIGRAVVARNYGVFLVNLGVFGH